MRFHMKAGLTPKDKKKTHKKGVTTKTSRYSINGGRPKGNAKYNWKDRGKPRGVMGNIPVYATSLSKRNDIIGGFGT